VPNYTEILITLREELERLDEVRHKIDQQMRGVTGAIEALEMVAKDANQPIMPSMLPGEEQGFTDRVRGVLKSNPTKRLSALEIRDMLLTPDSDPKIVLIHTHNTLKRLVKQKEIEEMRHPDGRAAFQWKGKVVIDLMTALKQSLAEMERNRDKQEIRINKEK
jgi:hypothetical protein